MNHINRAIAIDWFEAFNAHDLEQLLQLYQDDAEHYSPKLKLRHPETKGLIKGKSALNLWWQEAFNRFPSLRYELVSLTSNEDRVFMEYNRHVEGEDDMMVAEVLEIQDGKITTSRVYHG